MNRRYRAARPSSQPSLLHEGGPLGKCLGEEVQLLGLWKAQLTLYRLLAANAN